MFDYFKFILFILNLLFLSSREILSKMQLFVCLKTVFVQNVFSSSAFYSNPYIVIFSQNIINMFDHDIEALKSKHYSNLVVKNGILMISWLPIFCMMWQLVVWNVKKEWTLLWFCDISIILLCETYKIQNLYTTVNILSAQISEVSFVFRLEAQISFSVQLEQFGDFIFHPNEFFVSSVIIRMNKCWYYGADSIKFCSS